MYSLPALRYTYGDLAPHISEDIMRLHHTKHHQTYVDKLNKALKEAGVSVDKPLVTILRSLDTIAEAQKQTVRNNAGGHYNHSLFWEIMSPQGGGEPESELLDAITAKYGSFGQFVDNFSEAATGLFGSGWVWLMPDMTITTSSNQDNPIMEGGDEPLLGLDVWEHAYYLDYKNARPDYIKAWWNVVDWPAVQARAK